jgi:glycosyltransferase involved in cell wall biosynthesis
MYTNALNWSGWNNPQAGYGIVNLEYSTAIERITGKVSIGWERKENMLPDLYEQLTPEQKKLLDKPYKKERIGVIKTTPQMFYMNKSEFRIGYTMVENTQISKTWIDLCNQMDAMFVPSNYLIDVFKECGLTKPVVAVKQGINSSKFPYIKRKVHTPYVFGTIGYQDHRKNWQDLVTAFTSEFDEKEPVELWIKNSNGYFNNTGFYDPRIKLINRLYTFEEIQKLYSFFDCFVFPSHAEGSGLPPREAMATGLPVILTNWSGLTEIADTRWSYPLIPVAIDIPDVRGPEQPGFMARIDVTELMYWMRYVYEHQTEANEKGKLASEFIHKEYNWDSCAKDLLTKLEVFI